MLSPTGSERNFLAAQAAAAKTAMLETLRDIKETLKRSADLRSCARQYPWLLTGSAVGIGFVTGVVLTPSPQDTRGPLRATSERGRQPSCQERNAPRTRKSFLIATAETLLAGVVRTVVQKSIAAATAAENRAQGEDDASCDLMTTVTSGDRTD